MFLTTILQIFATIIIPLFLLIGVGFVADRCFRLDQQTLSRVCFHLLLPPLIFIKVLESTIDLAQMRVVILVTLAQIAILLPLAYLAFSRGPFRPQRLLLSLCTAFFNCGNYGIPLAELAFPGIGVGVMAVVLMTQNFATFSLGIYLVERRDSSARRILLGFLKMPIIHAILAAFLLRLFPFELPTQLQQSLHYLGNGLVPVALITLGVQLSRSPLTRNLPSLLSISVGRLILSPLIAWGLVNLFDVEPPLSTILIVAAGLPVAVNVYIVASEYDDLDSALASQTIFWTTLLSALTLSVLLAIVS